MGKVIQRVDAPLVSCVLVRNMGNAVDDRVTHIHVRGCHINFGAEYPGPIRINSRLHFLKKLQILFHGTITAGAVFARLRQCAPVRADFIGAEIIDIGIALFDDPDRIFIHLVKVVGRIEKIISPVGAKPPDICLDGFDKFGFFLRRVGIIKTKMERSVILLSYGVVQQYGLGVPNVKITVGFRRKTCNHPVHTSVRKVLIDELFNKIFRVLFHKLSSS